MVAANGPPHSDPVPQALKGPEISIVSIFRDIEMWPSCKSDYHLPITKKVEWALKLHDHFGPFLRADHQLCSLLNEYRRAIEESAHCIQAMGIHHICSECDRLQGGSCCGAGIESKFDSVLLLINLLLGVSLEKRDGDSRSCYFLGPRGCTLKARHVLCVNYLCEQIVGSLRYSSLRELQETTGREMDVQFRVNERVLQCLRHLRVFLQERAIDTVIQFYDNRKIGVSGTEGDRKSTDLSKLRDCLAVLSRKGFLDPGRTVFLDLGAGDGRVCVLLGYWVNVSLGIELEEDLLDRHESLSSELFQRLDREHLPRPPGRIFLLQGDSLKNETYERIQRTAGFGFNDIDVFYTHFTLHDAFAEQIATQAKAGALYLVYGLNKVIPRYPGLEPLYPHHALNGILGVYRKETTR